MTTQTTDRSPTKAIKAGWICFAIGTAAMFFSLATFFIYGPLFFAAFILSIVGMAQGRVSGGVILLLVTLAIPTISWIGLFAVNVGDAMQEAKVEKRQALENIGFEEIKGYIDGNYMYLEGKVRNNGSKDVEFVKVTVEWLDANEKVLDTDWTYAVSGDGLRPGAAKSFKIMTTVDKSMEKFRYGAAE